MLEEKKKKATQNSITGWNIFQDEGVEILADEERLGDLISSRIVLK